MKYRLVLDHLVSTSQAWYRLEHQEHVGDSVRWALVSSGFEHQMRGLMVRIKEGKTAEVIEEFEV